MDPSLPASRALAIAGPYVAGGVGVHETALASPNVVDLGGRCVLPAFTDSHVHFPTWSLAQKQVTLDGCASLDEALARVRDAEILPRSLAARLRLARRRLESVRRPDQGGARRGHGRDADDHDLEGLPLRVAELRRARSRRRRSRARGRRRGARPAGGADRHSPGGGGLAVPRPLRPDDRGRVGGGDASGDQAGELARRRRRSTTRTAGSARPASSSGCATRGTSRCGSGARSRTTTWTTPRRSRCAPASETSSSGSAT